MKRVLTVQTHAKYVYDAARVQSLHDQLKPDPDVYGDEPAYALFAYLQESAFGGDVFANEWDFDQYPMGDEEHDPDA